MIEFEKVFTGVSEYDKAYSPPGFDLTVVRPEKGEKLAFADICQQIPKRKTGADFFDSLIEQDCVISPRLIDFFYDAEKGEYDMTAYKDD